MLRDKRLQRRLIVTLVLPNVAWRIHQGQLKIKSMNVKKKWGAKMHFLLVKWETDLKYWFSQNKANDQSKPTEDNCVNLPWLVNELVIMLRDATRRLLTTDTLRSRATHVKVVHHYDGQILHVDWFFTPVLWQVIFLHVGTARASVWSYSQPINYFLIRGLRLPNVVILLITGAAN